MDKKLIGKVLMMAIALGVVIYGIKALKSPEVAQNAANPDSAISALLGSDLRPLNWCPEKVSKIEIYNDQGAVERTVDKSQDLISLCEVMIGSATQDKLDKAQFTLRMAAHAEDKTPRTLEQSKDGKLFRTEGMPFSSSMMEKALGRVRTPSGN